MTTEYHNYSEIFPIAEINEQLKERVFNNVAHEINVLLGAGAFNKGPVKLFDKSISLVEGKYVVISPDGKPISYHPDAESAIKALLFVNMAESAFGKSIKQENGKYVVYEGDKPIKICPDYATAVVENAKIQIGKVVKEMIAEIDKVELTKQELDELEEIIKVSGKVNANGEFAGGFDGCVKHMQDQGKSADSAKKLCAYIGRRAGKIKSADESTVNKSSLSVTKMEDGSLSFTLEFPITKLDNEKRLVGGIVYEPDVVDAQNDSASEAEIEKAAHKFLEESRTLGLMHKEAAGPRAKIVESYVAPSNLKMGAQSIRKGTWVMVVKVYDNELWDAVKSGKITGFSMGGRAREEKA